MTLYQCTACGATQVAGDFIGGCHKCGVGMAWLVAMQTVNVAADRSSDRRRKKRAEREKARVTNTTGLG